MTAPDPAAAADGAAIDPDLAREADRVVDEALVGRGTVRRAGALRAVTALFETQADRLGERAVGVFDVVMLRLAQDLGTSPRANLAERLADLPNAPPRTVRDLAFDPEVRVAAPVLARSARLEDGDLVRVASARGAAHLLAITRRRSLSERVADILVERGDEAVVQAVAGHADAALSAEGMAALTSRAGSDAALRAALDGRLAPTGSSSPADGRGDAQGPDAAPKAALDAAPETLPGIDADLAGHLRAAAAAVAARGEGRPGLGIGEDDVAAWLREGRVAEALTALARIAGVPVAAALRAHRAPQYDPLLFLARAARLDWSTARLFLDGTAAARGTAIPAALRRAAHDAATLESGARTFEGLSTATAQRVLRFSAQRESAAGAAPSDAA